jgi:hypothetical protein
MPSKSGLCLTPIPLTRSELYFIGNIHTIPLWHLAGVLIGGGYALFAGVRENYFVQFGCGLVRLGRDKAANKPARNMVFLSLMPNNPADPRTPADL